MSVGSSMTREEQVPLRVGNLFSRFNIDENPTISEYIRAIPDTLTETVNILLSSKFKENYPTTEYSLANRKRLVQYIKQFHNQADTLTLGVNDSLDLLEDPTSRILVSIHQPNLFAYGVVYKKIVLLETLRKIAESRNTKARFINLFLIIDHDFMDDMWIRLAQLPSIRHKGGILEIRAPVNNSKRWQMICSATPPPKNIVDSWKKQVKVWIKNAATKSFDKTSLLRNFDNLWNEVEDAHARSKSHADFSAFFQSKVVNEIWDYRTPFVRLSDISPVFDKGFEFLLSNHLRYSKAVEEAEKYFIQRNIDTGVSSTAYLNAPVWIHCSCGSKASAKMIREGTDMLLRGKCMSCKRDLQTRFEDTQGLELSEEDVLKLSPRAIPILLLLSRELGVGCYASGTGGSVGYAILGSLIFRELSVRMPLTVVWPSDDRYLGVGQSEALESLQLKNKEDVEDYLKELRMEDSASSREIKPLLVERDRLMREGQPIEAVLQSLFLLKEKQRKLHGKIKCVEKARNSLYLKPCFLDYGINFGMRKVESLWRQNLIENDDLMLPCILSSKD